MGGISAMNSIQRVLDKHPGDLKQETLKVFRELNPDIPDGITYDCALSMSEDGYGIDVTWTISGTMESRMPGIVKVHGGSIDVSFGLLKFQLELIRTWCIDRLAEIYPDCEVGY